MHLAPFLFIARHARSCLVIGLIAGLILQPLAIAMKPWLPTMVAVLLFVSALRIGSKAAIGQFKDVKQTFVITILYQLALPISALAIVWALGLTYNLFALAFVLMLSAPSITGNQNFAAIMGHDPAPPMRMLIIGTAAFPITVLPVLWVMPGLGGAPVVLSASLKLVFVISIAVGLGFWLRHLMIRTPSADQLKALDGLGALILSIIVVGLMSAVGPLLITDPLNVLLWLVAVLIMNFGLQVASFAWFRHPGYALVAGNRNVALFLVALPPEIIAPLLIFIGCYQIPMYLTPVVMDRLYKTAQS